MIEIDLNDEERATVVTALDEFISDLRMEIAGTDSMDYRENLKTRKNALIKLAESLRSS